MIRTLFLVTAAAVLTVTASTSALSELPRHTTYLTFNTPISLPGVSLPAGTYIFELADSQTSEQVVQVLSRDRAHTYLLTLTRNIVRPKGLGDRFITFAEGRVGATPRVAAWYPFNDSTGHEFIYR
jgi:hypothetical protein